MIIECNEISQTCNELLIAFQDCNKIKNKAEVFISAFAFTYRAIALNYRPDQNIEGDSGVPIWNIFIIALLP